MMTREREREREKERERERVRERKRERERMRERMNRDIPQFSFNLAAIEAKLAFMRVHVVTLAQTSTQGCALHGSGIDTDLPTCREGLLV